MITTTLFSGTLSQQSVDTYLPTCALLGKELKSNDTPRSPYLFFSRPHHAEETIAQAHHVIQTLNNTRAIDNVVVIGIGGSSLGTQAVYSALRHHLPETAPQLWCADTIDPVTTHALLRALEHALAAKKNIVFVIISKSGTTLETCAHASLYLEMLRAHAIDSARHVIIITDQGSALETYAQQHSIPHAFIPSSLGGRFSVFSAVGIVPLILLGINVTELLRGARAANILLDSETNDIYLQTATLAAAYDAGYYIHDTFVSAPHLMGYAAWYRQLLAESLGKCTTTNNITRRMGMTPTVSCIANDLHSMAQLYLAGPRRTITTFVDVSCTTIPAMPIAHHNGNKFGLNHTSVEHIHRALCTGIYTAYHEAQLPCLHTTSTHCSAETLGHLMQQQMIIVTLLGHLWDINPFDQPQVEDYKKWTRAALAKSNNSSNDIIK